MPEDTFVYAEPEEGGPVAETHRVEGDAVPLDVAAERLRLSQAALRMRLRRGKAKGYKSNGRWYVHWPLVASADPASDEDTNAREEPVVSTPATRKAGYPAARSDTEQTSDATVGDAGARDRSSDDLDQTDQSAARQSIADAAALRSENQPVTADSTSEGREDQAKESSTPKDTWAADPTGLIEDRATGLPRDEPVEPLDSFAEQQTSSNKDTTPSEEACEPSDDLIEPAITNDVPDMNASSLPEVTEPDGVGTAAQETTSFISEEDVAASLLKDVEGSRTAVRRDQAAPLLTGASIPEPKGNESAPQNEIHPDRNSAADISAPGPRTRGLPFFRSRSSPRRTEKRRVIGTPGTTSTTPPTRAISDTTDRITAALGITNDAEITPEVSVAPPVLVTKTDVGKADRREPRLSVPETVPAGDKETRDRDLVGTIAKRHKNDRQPTDAPQEEKGEREVTDTIASTPNARQPSAAPTYLPANYQLFQQVAIPIAPLQQEAAGKTGEGEDSEQQTLLQNLDVVWRKKRVVVGCIVMFVTLAWAAISQVAPRYTAEALVLIKPSADKVVDIENVVSGLADDPTEILNQVQILRSRRLADRVIDETGLTRLAEFNPFLQAQQSASSPWSDLISQTTALFRGASASPQEPAIVDEEKLRTQIVNKFRNALSVAPVGESSVISVNFTSQNPDVAALVTNKIADLYVLDQLEAKYEGTQLAAEWLQGRISVLRETVQKSEAAVERFRANAGLLKSSSNTTLLTEQITQLSNQRVEARADLADIQSKLSIAEKLALENDLKSLADVMNSPVILQQRQEEAQILRRRAELASEVGPRHPLLVNLTAELRDIQDQLDREVNSVLSRMRADVRVAQTRLDTLTNELGNFEGNAEEANQAQVGLRALEREASANRTLFETFLNRFKETEEQEELSRPDARVISYAAVPQEPSFPKKAIVLLAAVVVSAVFGVFLVFMLDMAHSNLQSLDQIETLGLPPLALVPLVEKLHKKKRLTEFILDNPGSAFAESLRALHTSVLVSDVENRTRCVLITSTLPGEGKTTLAVSLARLLAGMGSRVLLIDCDMRRPSVHVAVGVDNHIGLIDHLVGAMSRTAITRKDPKSNVAIVTPGSLTRNAVDLLRSRQMREVVDAFKQDYDMVILDSAPLLPVSDARILAGVADTTIFAVKWRSTRRRHVKNAVRLLRDARANVLGAVLTQVDVRKHSKERYSDSGYYTKAYDAYYTN